jgi:hypothetical protein
LAADGVIETASEDEQEEFKGSSQRASDDSWSVASAESAGSAVGSWEGGLQRHQLSSSMSVTSSLISMKRQSLQSSGQFKGLASYAHFAAAAQQQKPPVTERNAAHSVEFAMPGQLSLRKGQPSSSSRSSSSRSSSAASSRRGSQLSSSCSVLAGCLGKRQVRAEIAAAGGMAAIVEQFSSSLGLLEDSGGLHTAAGGLSIPALQQDACSWPRGWACAESVSCSVDALLLGTVSFRAVRSLQKPAAGVQQKYAGYASSCTVQLAGGDNSPRVCDQLE